MNQLTTLTVHLVVFFIILLVFVGVLIFCVLIIVFVLCWACNQIKWLKKIWMTKNDESSQEINWKISVLAIIYRKHTTQTRSQGGIWVISTSFDGKFARVFKKKSQEYSPPFFVYKNFKIPPRKISGYASDTTYHIFFPLSHIEPINIKEQKSQKILLNHKFS